MELILWIFMLVYLILLCAATFMCVCASIEIVASIINRKKFDGGPLPDSKSIREEYLLLIEAFQ